MSHSVYKYVCVRQYVCVSMRKWVCVCVCVSMRKCVRVCGWESVCLGCESVGDNVEVWACRGECVNVCVEVNVCVCVDGKYVST